MPSIAEIPASPPPLSSLTLPWMPLTCMSPPPLVRSTAVCDGTSSVAFSPQLPVGSRQCRLMPLPLTVKSGRTRLYWTVPVSRAVAPLT